MTIVQQPRINNNNTDVIDDIEDIKLNNLFQPSSPSTSSSTSIVKIKRISNKPDNRNNRQSSSSSSCCGNNDDCSCHHHHHHHDNNATTTLHHTDIITPQQQQQCEEETQSSAPPPPSNDLNPSNYTIYVKTWGCSHNNSDSEYMCGLLSKAGYNVTTSDYTSSSIIILNSCTVKGPSEQHFKNDIDSALKLGKKLILAGCVPQSDKSYRKLASIIGVKQIEKIVEVVEETLAGNKVSYLSGLGRNGKRVAGHDLSLPKIRKNELIEIIAISTGCLNNCTYCKTKLARGQLVSYPIDSIISRIHQVVMEEGVKEIWLTSEDLGAYGIDIGLTIVDLLVNIVKVLETSSVMLRLGMTNPPYILDHLEEISNILSHPNVYEFLHIPVQSGSDPVLLEMKREYCVKDFERICDFMLQRHPTITIATDFIVGYPTETEEDFKKSLSLLKKYNFPVTYINQFYPRPGTPAAKLKRIKTEIVKSRTRTLNSYFQSYSSIPHTLLHSTQRVLITDFAHDKKSLAGHNKSYQQVIITTNNNNNDMMMGKWINCKITNITKFSMIGQPNYATNKRFFFIIIIITILLCISISIYFNKY